MITVADIERQIQERRAKEMEALEAKIDHELATAWERGIRKIRICLPPFQRSRVEQLVPKYQGPGKWYVTWAPPLGDSNFMVCFEQHPERAKT